MVKTLPLDSFSYLNHLTRPFSVEVFAVAGNKIYCEKYSTVLEEVSKKLGLPTECIAETKFMNIPMTKLIVAGTKKRIEIVSRVIDHVTDFTVKHIDDDMIEFTNASG